MSGDDSRSANQAQNPATPWKTIGKLNASFNQFKAGDSILFKAGESFYGGIAASQSGNNNSPIVFSGYGTGSKPEITGFLLLTSWSNAGGNVWTASLPATQSRVSSVVVNGGFKACGRYPNASASNNGFLTISSAQGSSSITDQQLSGSPNWAGGEVVIRKARWVVDRNIITQHQQNTISYTSQSGYGASAGYGYFIQNHPSTLDESGEWYYNSGSNKFGIFSSGAPSAGSVRVSTVENLVSMDKQSNLNFVNLSFTGANSNAFYIDHSKNIRIIGCDISYSGFNALTVWNTKDLTVESNTINYTNNNACAIQNCDDLTLKANKVNNTGINPGMGDGDSGSYEAFLLSGDDQEVSGNTIINTGYIPVTFSGKNVVIKNNVINNFAFVKDDGGGIYTWNNGSNPPSRVGQIVSGNIVLNGLGAGKGTPDPDKLYANGIYMDDNVGGVEINGNTVANCNGYGLYIHNAHDLVIKSNTVYNNTVQLEMTHDDIAPYPITNVALNNNTFVAKLASQSVAEFKTNANDINSFGSFDNNYYSRPLSDQLQIGVLTKENGNYKWATYNLDGWKSVYGKDQNSKISPFPIAAYKVNSTTSGNLFPNGNFDSNIGGLYAFASANNATTTWNNGALDGGALQVSFSSLAGNGNKASVIIGVGNISASKTYILKFSLKGRNENKVMEAYLRQSGAPYADITSRSYTVVTNGRTEQEILFKPTANESNASIGLDIPEHSGPVYIDNIQLVEANVTMTNPDDSIRFVYNDIPSNQSTSLNGSYADIANTTYNTNINLAGYSSAVLLKKSSTTTPVDDVVCSATGTILREQWDNISGNDISSIPTQTSPTSSSQLTLFESASDIADNYGARIRGYICPPQTGNYTFWVAGDDATELWLSTNDDPANKSKIAYSLSWTNAREWNKYATQKSATIYLQAGHKYYVEALQKEGAGGDNLAVAWQLPSGSMEAPIPGIRLSPSIPTSLLNQTITFSPLASVTLGILPFTLTATASSGLPVSFRLVSGPAVLNGSLLTITGIGTVTIEASQAGNATYNPATAVAQSFSVLGLTVASTCSGTGTILREQWDNISGNDVSLIPTQNTPDRSMQLSSFESPINYADNYGARIRGYVCPPQSGYYTFWIASDDASELWLSTNDDPANKAKIAYSLSWTNSREWNKYASQKSVAIYLQAGYKYYIEALQKEGNGGDNLAVAWQIPNGTLEAPIPGNRLSPVVVTATTACAGTGGITREQWNNVPGNDVNLVPVALTPTSTSQLSSFEAPTDISDNYAARVRGYVCPPQTGYYTFWIAADDASELWLSTDENPGNKVKLAYSLSWTDPREWNKYSTQKSVTVYLKTGYKYYIEALHKEGAGGDNLAVAWQLPNGTMEAPIPGNRLIPYLSTTTQKSSNQVQLNATVDVVNTATITLLNVYPNPFTTSAVIEVNQQEAGAIKLDVLDEQGRVVKQFANGTMVDKAVTKRFTLSGSELRNGMYIIRLVTKNGTVTKKVVLQK